LGQFGENAFDLSSSRCLVKTCENKKVQICLTQEHTYFVTVIEMTSRSFEQMYPFFVSAHPSDCDSLSKQIKEMSLEDEWEPRLRRMLEDFVPDPASRIDLKWRQAHEFMIGLAQENPGCFGIC